MLRVSGRYRCSRWRPYPNGYTNMAPMFIFADPKGTDSNGTSPIAPTRASPSPPTSAAGSPLDEHLSRVANAHAAAPATITHKDPKMAAQAANDMNIVRRKLTGYVGFANLPNQWHRKSVRKGFNFNVMVVGMSNKSPWKYIKSGLMH